MGESGPGLTMAHSGTEKETPLGWDAEGGLSAVQCQGSTSFILGLIIAGSGPMSFLFAL